MTTHPLQHRSFKLDMQETSVADCVWVLVQFLQADLDLAIPPSILSSWLTVWQMGKGTPLLEGAPLLKGRDLLGRAHPFWKARPFWKGMSNRGLQCFKLYGNHTENDRYWQKNKFLLFAKCLKMYSFFRICILRLQKVLLWPQKFFLKNINLGIQKTQNFMLISNSLMPT